VSPSSSDNRNASRPGQSGQFVGVRLQPDDLAALDAWIADQADPPSRPEAMRRLMRQALSTR